MVDHYTVAAVGQKEKEISFANDLEVIFLLKWNLKAILLCDGFAIYCVNDVIILMVLYGGL